jgi:hypothetical protein
MAPHVTAATVALLLMACLEDKVGLVALVGECPSGASYAKVAEVDGDFAIGPCGEVVYWDEGVSREVTFLSAQHRVLERRADPGGYGGMVAISPRGRVALTSFRSDVAMRFPHHIGWKRMRRDRIARPLSALRRGLWATLRRPDAPGSGAPRTRADVSF